MKRTLCLALTAVAAAACTSLPEQGAPLAGHPILGTWEIPMTPRCSETETFHADGTRHFITAAEVGESTFTISPPDARGVYTMVDTITKDNGKPDCLGSAAPVGDVATLYLRFNQAHDVLVTCFDAALTRCFIAKRMRDI